MHNQQGFTLIETLITALVLVTGLAAIAGLFSVGAQTSLKNRQRTAATALLYSKMDELKTAEELTSGQYAEYISTGVDGAVISRDENHAPYLRTWKIEAASPKRVTVIVYGRQSGRLVLYQELARATLLVADGF